MSSPSYSQPPHRNQGPAAIMRPVSSFLTHHTSDRNNLSQLPPEIEQGNVEYKLKLVDPSPERIEHLVTQLKWRLAEGSGEAMYEIGVADNGLLVGLSPSDLEESLSTLRHMGSALQADMFIVRQRKVSQDRIVAEVLFRKSIADAQHFLELRIAMLGSGDAGKSTLLGVLTHSELDNGRGKSRLNLLRHRHEIESGRTSSISHQIIGFNPSGELINYATQNIFSWEQICENASKIVTFLDTCGHPKYQRTTISGLSGNAPDFACLILSANSGGFPDISREHLNISVALNVPIFVVMTKIDVATPSDLSDTVQGLLASLQSPGIRRTPVVIQTEDDVVASVTQFVESRVVPIFLTSSVTGENMDLLFRFLNLLPKPTHRNDSEKSLESETEYHIEEVYSVPDVGCVVGGIVTAGRMHLSPFQPRIFWLGPDRGHYVPVLAHSLHRQRCSVKYVQAGQAASCAILFKESPSTSTEVKDITAGISSISVSPVSSSPMSLTTPTRRQQRKRKSNPDTGFCFGDEDIDQNTKKSVEPTNAGDGWQTTPSNTAGTMQYEGWSRLSPSTFRLRKGQVLLTTSNNQSPVSYWEFEADMNVLYHSSALSVGCSGLVYCGSIRQGGRVVQISPLSPLSPLLKPTSLPISDELIDGSCLPQSESATSSVTSSPTLSLQTGQQGRIKIRFASEPEYLSVGRTILFKDENRMKCVGKIVSVTCPFVEASSESCR